MVKSKTVSVSQLDVYILQTFYWIYREEENYWIK